MQDEVNPTKEILYTPHCKTLEKENFVFLVEKGLFVRHTKNF